MNENETLNQKIKFMESLLYNLDIKAVSKELNYAVNDKRRALNLMNLLNTVSETKIDTTKYQEYIDYANQIKKKLYDERKKRAIAGAFSSSDDTEVTPIDCFSYKIINDNKIEITKFNRTFVKYIKIPSVIEGLPVTSIGFSSFAGANIDALVIPSSIINIESYAFRSANIGYLTISENIKDIFSDAFNECDIERIRLSDGVKIIESRFFYDAYIKMIRISSSIQSIKVNAFFTKNNLVHILFENGDNIYKLPELENAFPPNATLYTDNLRLLSKLKEYKDVNRKCWDISDDVDEFELEWAIHTKSRDAKH